MGEGVEFQSDAGRGRCSDLGSGHAAIPGRYIFDLSEVRPHHIGRAANDDAGFEQQEIDSDPPSGGFGGWARAFLLCGPGFFEGAEGFVDGDIAPGGVESFLDSGLIGGFEMDVGAAF